MISFNEYLQQEYFVLQLAEELFNIDPLLEADSSFDIQPNSPKIKYRKDNGQFVACSSHTKDYGDREWYSSYSDPKFIDFSEKVLAALRNWNNLPNNSYDGSIPKPKTVGDETKLGVCDSTKTYGWKIAVKESFNKYRTPDSCYVITCFNKNAPSMSKTDSIFTLYNGKKRIDDYVVNVDKVYVHNGKDEAETKLEIEKLNLVIDELEQQISELKYELEFIELEFEDTPNNELKKKIEYTKGMLKDTKEKLIQKINTKTNMEKSLTENYNVYTITKDDKQVQIIIL